MSASFGKMDRAVPASNSPDKLRSASEKSRHTSQSESSPTSPPGHTSNGMNSMFSSFDKQLRHGGPSPQDRVFPIRSIVSVDPMHTPLVAQGSPLGGSESFPGLSIPGSTPEDIVLAARVQSS